MVLVKVCSIFNYFIASNILKMCYQIKYSYLFLDFGYIYLLFLTFLCIFIFEPSQELILLHSWALVFNNSGFLCEAYLNIYILRTQPDFFVINILVYK